MRGSLKSKLGRSLLKSSMDTVSVSDLQSHGGAWLGRARSYIQRRAINGEHVRWGSEEPVNGLTVRDIETMAAEIAAAAINDDRKYRRDTRQPSSAEGKPK